MRHNVVLPRFFREFIFLTIAVFFATVVVAGDKNIASESLAVRLNKACSEKKIDDRLNALANVAKTLSLPEITEAIKAAEGLKQLRERVVLTESVLKRWGELAPSEAFAHISELPEGMEKVESIRGVVPLYAKNDLRAAVAAATKMNPGRSRNEAVQMLAEIWTKDDAKTAINWVNSLPAGFPKEEALRDIYFVWVHLDPAGISSTCLLYTSPSPRD